MNQPRSSGPPEPPPGSAPVPPGWPRQVPPAGAPGWERAAVGWLLDLCPPDYRGYPVLARHPKALARLAALHVAAAAEGCRRALSTARADLGPVLPPPALAEILAALEAEQVRLLAAERAVGLVERALLGYRYVPRL